MPYFSYKARNANGELLQGVLEAADSGACADHLLGIGIVPVEIAAAEGPEQVSRGGWLDRLLQPPVGTLEVMLFSRHMHTLLKAGVPILRALSGLRESTRNKRLNAVLEDIGEGLDSGRELNESLRRHPDVFSPFYVAMVRVGEATGRLEEVFLRLFEHLEFDRHTREQIRAALRYPAFVVGVMGVALTIINLFVIPAFVKVYRGFHTELPLMTRALIAFSDFTVHYWPALLALAALLVLAARAYLKTPGGRYQWDKYKLRLPIVGSIVEKATLARFARSMSLAGRSGVPILQALGLVGQVVDNDYVGGRVEQMRIAVERGESILRAAAATGIFTPVVLQMVAVGEETGALDELMDGVAGMYEREVEYQVKNLSADIEPLLILAIGAMVLVLALGVFLPIWDIGRAMLHR